MVSLLQDMKMDKSHFSVADLADEATYWQAQNP